MKPSNKHKSSTNTPVMQGAKQMQFEDGAIKKLLARDKNYVILPTSKYYAHIMAGYAHVMAGYEKASRRCGSQGSIFRPKRSFIHVDATSGNLRVSNLCSNSN